MAATRTPERVPTERPARPTRSSPTASLEAGPLSCTHTSSGAPVGRQDARGVRRDGAGPPACRCAGNGEGCRAKTGRPRLAALRAGRWGSLQGKAWPRPAERARREAKRSDAPEAGGLHARVSSDLSRAPGERGDSGTRARADRHGVVACWPPPAHSHRATMHARPVTSRRPGGPSRPCFPFLACGPRPAGGAHRAREAGPHAHRGARGAPAAARVSHGPAPRAQARPVFRRGGRSRATHGSLLLPHPRTPPPWRARSSAIWGSETV